MPSQITHILFGEEALFRSLPDSTGWLRRNGPAFRLGCQGPDIFYHNMRTRPSGIRYGILLHRRDYGMVAEAMVREAARVDPDGGGAAYAAGFVTHGILDQAVHPYIVFFAGWHDPALPETKRYRRSHAFFERVLDVCMLRSRRSLEPRSFDCFRAVFCGAGLPASIESVLATGLEQTYARAREDVDLRQRLRNAYFDSMGFYESTNPSSPVRARIAAELDRQDGGPRRLALFHPDVDDSEIDFLNLRHDEWLHPCDGIRRNESYLGLYDTALERAARALSVAFDGISGRRPIEGLHAAAGNESLNLVSSAGKPCSPRHARPLPLPELLERQYARLEHA